MYTRSDGCVCDDVSQNLVYYDVIEWTMLTLCKANPSAQVECGSLKFSLLFSQTSCWKFEMPVIWDDMMLMWRPYNAALYVDNNRVSGCVDSWWCERWRWWAMLLGYITLHLTRLCIRHWYVHFMFKMQCTLVGFPIMTGGVYYPHPLSKCCLVLVNCKNDHNES